MIVLVIVLLLFLIIIKFGDASGNTAEVGSSNFSLQRQQHWRNMVEYSEKEEQRLNEATYSPSKYWEMEKDALRVINSLPGLEYARFKDKGVPRKHGASREIVRLIEAVQHGKVPHSITHTVYPLENALDMYVPKEAYIEFGKWLESTIRENGVPDAELYVQALGGYKALVWGPFQKLYGPYTDGGIEVQNIRVTDSRWIEKINAFSSELCDELNAPIIARNKESLRLHEEWRAERERKEAEQSKE